MSGDLRQIYDRFADTYEQNRGLFDMSEVIDDFSRRLPERPGRLLDLGCGAGEPFPAFFITRGWRVTGVDFSSRMLELARHYQPNMETVEADIRNVEFPDRQFDAVTAIYCLFHIEHEKHEGIFQKIFRWMKPAGKLLFTYATKEYTGAEIFNGYKEFMGEKLFYSHTTPGNLAAILKTIGFTIESETYRNIGGETFLWMTVAKPG
ncbi:MAG TPA: methyltransferase domain-containing protein [Smithellaceae bacterium]|nr:methyltransferase domain-containing protein [Smithellaceae bacterium]HOH57211.1 methyltransferase domain-containing protein [Smithellaceae bacterium]HPB15105.1 methyltransferase domain-containing protein [Smithellaceae bacterium]HQH05369.1 methyltransferase domain-containing protein [Smithellaceae bacterium]